MPFDTTNATADTPSTAATRHRPPTSQSGFTLTSLSLRLGLPRDVLVGLMLDHGMLELATWNGRNRRYFLTDRAVEAGLGRNIEPMGRRGGSTSSPFPVIYAERADDIAWCLDYDGLRQHVLSIANRRHRLAYLLEFHPSLPEAAIAALCGYHKRTVRRARAGKCPLQV